MNTKVETPENIELIAEKVSKILEHMPEFSELDDIKGYTEIEIDSDFLKDYVSYNVTIKNLTIRKGFIDEVDFSFDKSTTIKYEIAVDDYFPQLSYLYDAYSELKEFTKYLADDLAITQIENERLEKELYAATNVKTLFQKLFAK